MHLSPSRYLTFLWLLFIMLFLHIIFCTVKVLLTIAMSIITKGELIDPVYNLSTSSNLLRTWYFLKDTSRRLTAAFDLITMFALAVHDYRVCNYALESISPYPPTPAVHKHRFNAPYTTPTHWPLPTEWSTDPVGRWNWNFQWYEWMNEWKCSDLKCIQKPRVGLV